MVAQVRDVVARAKVSPATVSNALNHPEKVSAQTLARIHAAIDELGYVRNDAARQLRAGTNRAVGMIVLDVANPFFTEVARGVEDQLAESRRPLLLGNSGQDAARETSYLDLFEEQRVAGILISPVGNVVARLRRLRDRGAAVVLVDRKSGEGEFSSVSVDDRLGGRLAAEHLVEGGRRRIVVIGGPGRLRQVKHRLEGAQQVAVEHRNVSVDFLDTGAMDVESGHRAVAELLARPRRQRPDAIFATNDLVALGVLQALTAAGVAVPDDVALVGYDDIEFAASATIPITSVRQPAHEMGETAAALLLETIGRPDRRPTHRVFTPELIAPRASS